jgi:large subunit ribosomal protein L1
MGTTRIKVIDLASEKEEIKTSRKRAEKLTGLAKIKEDKKPKAITHEKKAPEDFEKAEEKPETKKELEVKKESAPLKQTTTKQKTKVKEKKRGKKYQEALKLIEKNKAYLPSEAIDLLSKTSTANFDATVEVHLNLTDKNIRPKVNFPHQVGQKKEKKYLIFSDKPQEIKNKQIIWANEKTIREIEEGRIKPNRDFDVVLADPKFMPTLAKVAKILGPMGMMPNPKNGTITKDFEKFLKEENDILEIKQDPSSPTIHTKIGKTSFKKNQIEDNFNTLILSIGPSKIKKTIITSTMSPAIKVEIAEISKKATP